MLATLFLFRRPVYFGVLLFQLLLITDLTIVGLAKKGGGGGAGRGGGGGSKGGGIGRTNTGGGGRPAQPAYKPASSGNIGTGAGAGTLGNKKPSGSYGGGGSWKTHAAAGVAGAVVGAAISHKLTRSHYKYGYGGRDYYYGDRYYRPTYSYAKKCSYSLPESEYLRYDDDQTSVTNLVFECNGRTEYCCGMECCSNMPWWGILLVIVAVLALISCCVFVAMKYRRTRNTRFSNAATSEASVPLQSNTDYANGSKAYAAQPGGYYAGAPSYPSYPSAPANGAGWQNQPPPYPQPYGGYPPQNAPGYGFNAQPSGPYPRQY